MNINDYFSPSIEDPEYLFICNKKLLGVSSGDDKKLMLYRDERSTIIWWKANSGHELNIFDGRKLNDDELIILLDYLGIKNWL